MSRGRAMRRAIGTIAALAVAALVLPIAPATAAVAPLPERLRDIGNARQVLVVTAPNWSDPHASIEMWQKYSGGWSRKMVTRGRLGWTGFEWASQRRQNDGSTPAGTFTITRAFGLRDDPGTSMPYRRAWKSDYWVYDKRCASTYNTWQKYSSNRCWRMAWAEKLTSYQREYEFAAVIDFNLPTKTRAADTRRGGGIFLHVNGKGATAGCVSMGRADMLRILRWLDPAQHPRIVMAPRSLITRA